MKHVIEVLAQSREGLGSVALCGAFIECHSIEVSALVLFNYACNTPSCHALQDLPPLRIVYGESRDDLGAQGLPTVRVAPGHGSDWCLALMSGIDASYEEGRVQSNKTHVFLRDRQCVICCLRALLKNEGSTLIWSDW